MKRFDRELHLIMWAAETDGAGGITDWDILLDGCRKGDRKAQKRLFDRLSPKMFPLCIRYMGNREAAEDVLQEGFITLFSRLDSYAGKGSFEGWARRLFVNTALMCTRRKRRHRCRTQPLQRGAVGGGNPRLPGTDEVDRFAAGRSPDGLQPLCHRRVLPQGNRGGPRDGRSHVAVEIAKGPHQVAGIDERNKVRCKIGMNISER